jgi:hypothetical protein
MKIYFNKPKDNWISPYTIIEKAMFWRKIDYDEPIVEFWNGILSPFCSVLFDIRQFFNRDIRYIKIDTWDAWSLEHTLSPIILPILKELKRIKHGAPFIEDADVPPKLRANRDARYKGRYLAPDLHKINDNVDKKFFKRFDYILDEMIWTFEQLSMDDHEGKFYDHSKSKKIKDINKSVRALKIDRVGLRKHNERIDNGLRLFGKYYRTLWD